MEKIIDLRDLLKHEIMDLYSAEEQIIEALPQMIEKAGNDKLKAALDEHLKITEDQKTRLDEIKKLLEEAPAEGDTEESQKPGFFSRLFGDGTEKCKGMEGLIAEGKKMMSADMSPEASDAAIIASAQKIEHYEISGYGTARAFARELNLGEVAFKLEQTLNEEYKADDILTELAVGKVNVAAEFAGEPENGVEKSKPVRSKSNGRSTDPAKVVAAKKSTDTTKSNGKRVPVKTSPAKSKPSKSPSKSNLSKGNAPAKKTSSKGSSNNKTGKLKVAAKGNNSPVKKSSAKGRGNNTAGKSKVAVKKSGATPIKGKGIKSPSKSKSSRAR